MKLAAYWFRRKSLLASVWGNIEKMACKRTFLIFQGICLVNFFKGSHQEYFVINFCSIVFLCSILGRNSSKWINFVLEIGALNISNLFPES